MAVYKVTNKNIKTSGDAINGFIQGLGDYKESGLEILTRHGIHNPKPGHWYSLEDYLKAFQELETTFGHAALFSVGEKIPETAVLPPDFNSIDKGLELLNIAFHMNHSLDGKTTMFDPATGKIQEGIGNYVCKKINEGEAEITVNNAYPTSFDEGLIFGMAQRFNTASMVQLVEERSSRSKGGDADVYKVLWF